MLRNCLLCGVPFVVSRKDKQFCKRTHATMFKIRSGRPTSYIRTCLVCQTPFTKSCNRGGICSPNCKRRSRSKAMRKHYVNHKQEVLAWTKEYRRKYPELSRRIVRLRRCRIAGACGIHTHEQWLARVAYWGWSCRYCGKKLVEASLTQDHVIPISKGGSQWASNLVPACADCNFRKNARNWRDWLCQVAA
jgi:5-methylcytosine-specific restriction endonuclease McrA